MISTTTTVNKPFTEVSEEEMLASAYANNLRTIHRGLRNRLPRDNDAIAKAIDLIDEATLHLSIYLMGPSEEGPVTYKKFCSRYEELAQQWQDVLNDPTKDISHLDDALEAMTVFSEQHPEHRDRYFLFAGTWNSQVPPFAQTDSEPCPD